MLDTGLRFAFAFGPTGLAAVAGIVIAILKWRAEPAVSRLALIGFTLLLVAMVVTGAQVLVLSDLTGWTRGEVRALGFGSGIVILVLSAIGWMLLLFALYSRTTQRSAQPVAAPEPVDDGAPTGRHVLLDDTGAPVVAQEGTTLSRPWTGPGPMVGVGSDGVTTGPATGGDGTGSGSRAAAGAGLGIAGAGVAGAAFGAGVFGEPRRGDGPPSDALPTPGGPDASPAVSEDTPTQALALGDTSGPVATGADAEPAADSADESAEPATPEADPAVDPAAEVEPESESESGAEVESEVDPAVDPDPRPVADDEPEPATAADDEALTSADVAAAEATTGTPADVTAEPDDENAGEPGDDGSAAFDESALDDDAYDAYGRPRERPATPAPVVPRRPRPSPRPAAGPSPDAPDLATRAIPVPATPEPSAPAPVAAPSGAAADDVPAEDSPAGDVPTGDAAEAEATGDTGPVDETEGTDDTDDTDDPTDAPGVDAPAPEQTAADTAQEAPAASPAPGAVPGAVPRTRPAGGPSPLPHRVAGASGPRPAPFSNVATPAPAPDGPPAPQAAGHRPPGFPEPIRPGGAAAPRRPSDPHPWFTPTGSDADEADEDAPEQDGAATDARPGTRTGG